MRRPVSAVVMTASLGLLWACGSGTQLRDNPEFADAVRYAFAEFENPEPADLAFAIRRLEREVYLTVDVEASSSADRAIAPSQIAA